MAKNDKMESDHAVLIPKKKINRICPKSIKGHCECCCNGWCRYYNYPIEQINYDCEK